MGAGANGKVIIVNPGQMAYQLRFGVVRNHATLPMFGLRPRLRTGYGIETKYGTPASWGQPDASGRTSAVVSSLIIRSRPTIARVQIGPSLQPAPGAEGIPRRLWHFIPGISGPLGSRDSLHGAALPAYLAYGTVLFGLLLTVAAIYCQRSIRRRGEKLSAGFSGTASLSFRCSCSFRLSRNWPSRSPEFWPSETARRHSWECLAGRKIAVEQSQVLAGAAAFIVGRFRSRFTFIGACQFRRFVRRRLVVRRPRGARRALVDLANPLQ